LKIEIGNDYRLSTDPLSLILEKKHVKRNNKVVWDKVGFYSSLDGFIRGCLSHGIKTEDLEGVQEIKDYLDSLCAEIMDGFGKSDIPAKGCFSGISAGIAEGLEKVSEVEIFMTKKRDLLADLEICQKTHEGPWLKDELFIVDKDNYVLCDIVTLPDVTDFIIAAREGWPEAISRAIAAEAEVERLRNALSAIVSIKYEILNYDPEDTACMRQIAEDALRGKITR